MYGGAASAGSVVGHNFLKQHMIDLEDYTTELQEEAKNFFETASKMIQSKKTDNSPTEKECLNQMIKYLSWQK